MQTNGSYNYASFAGAPGAESVNEREQRERHWRSLGKRIRALGKPRG